MRALILTALLIFAADQAIKFFVLFDVFGLTWAEVTISPDLLPYPQKVDVFPPFLVLTMAWNKGINFGLFGGADLRWVLIGVALAICIFVLWWIRREKPGRVGYVSAGILIGGALGNVVDRVNYGAVADFLNMSCCGIRNPYAFNVADIAIFVGAIGLVMFTGKDNAKKSA